MSKPLKLDEFAQFYEQIHELRETNKRLQKELSRVRVNTGELTDAVYKAAKDALSGLEIPPVPRVRAQKGKSKPETAISLISDWQLGKRTPTYNSEICEKRVEEYGDKLLKIVQVQRADHPVNDLRVYLLGDLCEGELIFPGQAHRIDSSLYRQVIVDGPRLLNNFLRKMSGEFANIHVVGVIGNHGAIGGRSRREMHPETNGDFMMYRVAQEMLVNQKNITWNLPEVKGERSWYAIDPIGAYRFFLFHGDQMRGGGFGGLPFYGFHRAINNWSAGVIPGGFEYCVCGHWHQATSVAINGKMLWVGGSTESDNTWLQEELKAQAPPSQWLLFCHPDHGVTSEYRVWLT